MNFKMIVGLNLKNITGILILIGKFCLLEALTATCFYIIVSDGTPD